MNISSDAIIGICSTILGTVLGWILNSLSNSIGKIKICTCDLKTKILYRDVYKTIGTENNCVHQKYSGQEPESICVSFFLLVTNKKAINCGINSCKVYMKCKDRKYEINGVFQENDSVNELENLLNIEGKTTKKAFLYKSRCFGEKKILKK